VEDHREALFFWQSLGIRGACCIHVDAHLDTSEFDVPLLSAVPQPEINCGNYLLHALRSGVVREVIWVVPPHLCPGPLSVNWALEELARWNFLKTDDVATLRLEQGRIYGQLEGHPLCLCTSDNLPQVQDPCLLDIDADYFLDPRDEIWETPFELQSRLGPLSCQAVTVAYSVQGGYTPVSRRFLGDLTQMIYAGKGELAGHYWRLLTGEEETWPEDLPNWLRAARLVTQAQGSGLDHRGPAWQRAAELDPGYAFHPFDMASQRWQRQDFAGARRWLDQVDWIGADYLRGLIANSEKDYALALQCWGKLLQADLAVEHHSHLRHLCGLAFLHRGQPTQAAQEFRLALQGAPRQTALWRELARAQSQAGEMEAAAKSFRKSIQLAPDELATLHVRVELARLYLQLGQVSLAQAECQRIRSGWAPGNLKLEAESLAMKAVLRKTP